ncbi:hypothetical protein CHH80_22820 [Bacillus sp. 7504-2]|nr:hypothetical protein CHH80_22820 [Bacillus sp. 7504-2]
MAKLFRMASFIVLSKQDVELLKKILYFIRPHKLLLSIAFVFMFLSMCITTIQPLLFGQVIDAISYNNFNLIIQTISMLVVLFAVNLILKILKQKYLILVASKLEIELKQSMMKSILRLEYIDFKNIQHGELVNKLQNDVRTFSNVITQKISIIVDILAVIIIGIILFNINWKLALIPLIIFPVSLFIFSFYGKKIKNQEKIMKLNVDNFLTYLNENLLSFKLIRVYNYASKSLLKFKQLNRKIYETGINKLYLNITASSINEITNFFGYIAILVIGVLQIFLGKLTLGGLVAFNSYTTIFTNSLLKLSQLNAEIQEVLVSVQRIVDLLDKLETKSLNSSVNNTVLVNDQIKLTGVELKDVSFKFPYRTEQILNKVNLQFEPCSITTLIGPSGSGKSTILQLISGLYKEFEGEILIGKKDIRHIESKTLLDKICYISQEHNLFSDTIKENLLIGDPNASNKKISEICKKVNLEDTILSLEMGYETKIGYQGVQFSIGQQQRLSLARGLLKDADIYLFDEITASLDQENENIILEVIKELSFSKTIILVSHSEKSISIADKVYQIIAGNIKDVQQNKKLQTS